MMESYRTPAAPVTATVVEKKSEFIAALAPAETEQAALDFLAGVKAQHRTAAHHVYAYMLREGARSRYSDDGEPAKTAGLPVLGVLTHAPLTDCILVVTRYFGGTLLGTGGLVRAYTAAATAAVAAAEILTVRLCRRIRLQLPYPLYQPARRLLESAGARLEEPAFGAEVQLAATLPAEDAAALVSSFTELLRGEEGLSLGGPFYTPF